MTTAEKERIEQENILEAANRIKSSNGSVSRAILIIVDDKGTSVLNYKFGTIPEVIWTLAVAQSAMVNECQK